MYLMNPKYWWVPFIVILAVSLTGLIYIGYETYDKAPPIPDFTDASGKVVISREAVLKGQEVFHRYALMEYGSMFGDGALRGPDFTAQALHEIALSSAAFYETQIEEMDRDREFITEGIVAMVKKELKTNRYNEQLNQTVLTEAQVHSAKELEDFYLRMFMDESFEEAFKPLNYISNKDEIRDLSRFFFWGAWVCVVERPGEKYSYTHNWPFDEQAGNIATSSTMIWSIIGVLGLILALGGVLYFYGQFDKLSEEYYSKRASEMVTIKKLWAFKPSPTQHATYKFFYVAIILFFLQVLGGIITVHDFVGYTVFLGVDVRDWIPVTIARSWHLQLSLFWISACWVAISVFMLPILSGKEPKGQLKLINTLFWVFFVMVGGSVIGIFMGPKNLLGEWSRWLGHQGWEFVELGRLWQYLLFVVFFLWTVIVYRGLKETLLKKAPWALPNWLIYAVVAIVVLLLSGFIAQPDTNFVIADFWRWMVIHMWVEAFFEVFTTIVVGYMMVLMGLVNRDAVTKVVFLATLLFLGSGLLGISHNFYWNAKPVGTLALGSIFSTLQVVPLILLTLEAWKFRNMPDHLSKSNGSYRESSLFAMPGVFLFLIGVNFWNFFGAGVFGMIINLPIVNYYEHGTYLTVNHGHAALMGVYGNLSIAGLLFCLRYILKPDAWNTRLVKTTFWSINIGLFLMVILDLFPAGIHQLLAVMEKGYWFARSQTFINSTAFQSMTWLRIVGGAIFCVGGLFPLTWFVLKSIGDRKPLDYLPEATQKEKLSKVPAEV